MTTKQRPDFIPWSADAPRFVTMWLGKVSVYPVPHDDTEGFVLASALGSPLGVDGEVQVWTPTGVVNAKPGEWIVYLGKIGVYGEERETYIVMPDDVFRSEFTPADDDARRSLEEPRPIAKVDGDLEPPFVIHVNEIDQYPEAVYIGRVHGKGQFARSKWANPFRIGSELAPTRTDAIDAYRAHVTTGLGSDHDVMELTGKPLACWCRHSFQERNEDNTCHGDVLIHLWHKRVAQGGSP